jgi:hypothetical protein
MRSIRTVLFAGIAAAGLAGLSGLALARSPAFHDMTVQLPGGGVAYIRYTGDVAPKISFTTGPVVPFASVFEPWGSPFADLDRISAAMDRQMAEMMRQTQQIEQLAGSGTLNNATLEKLPAGMSSYSFVSTMSGNGFCSRTVQITSSPNGGKPQVVSHTSGRCGSQSMSAPALSKVAPSSNPLQSISVRANRAAAAKPDGRNLQGAAI